VRIQRSPEQQRLRTVSVAVLSGGVVAAAVIGLVWGLALNSTQPAAVEPPSAVSASEDGASENGASEDNASAATPAPSEPAPSASGTAAPPATSSSTGFVDASVSDKGLVPEPITSDAVSYGVEAARALVSFDATRVSRDQFAAYITTWLGNDPRYGNNAAVLRDARSRKADVIFTSIIGNSDRWAALGADKSVLTAVPSGEVKLDYDHVDPDPQEIRELIATGFHLVTVPLDVTTTAVQAGQPIAITEPITVTMQINCADSLPVGDTGQVSGDCKIIQYMTEPTL
jgi:hypothetical protein